MKSRFQFNRNQLLSLMSLMLLSPALRLFPNAAAETAAQAAVLTAPAALPFVFAYLYFICVFMDKRKAGEGLPELSLRALDSRCGRAALIAESAWMLLYSSFVLRSSADRMMTTIYPHASASVFIIVMGIICLAAALGSARSIIRTAKLLLPAVFGVLFLILLSGIFSIDRENLLPVTVADLLPVLKGSLAASDVLIVIICLSCFFIGFCPPSPGSFRDFSFWLIIMTAVISALCASVIGSFGSALTVRLTWPFFAFVRNIVFFRTLERTEALVVAIWMFPDFLLVSMLIYSAQYSLRLAMGQNNPSYRGENIFSLSAKRWVIPLCALVSTSLALIIAPDPVSLDFWSKKLIPVINSIFALLFIPGIYITGIVKKRL